jgi:hypothetical protein
MGSIPGMALNGKKRIHESSQLITKPPCRHVFSNLIRFELVRVEIERCNYFLNGQISGRTSLDQFRNRLESRFHFNHILHHHMFSFVEGNPTAILDYIEGFVSGAGRDGDKKGTSCQRNNIALNELVFELSVYKLQVLERIDHAHGLLTQKKMD